ncbi:MAG: UbiA family prenyltransferase [Desulfobacterales bacterium]|nr:UbiA family prenyltransferase [Desulfobacterales bacterium]
MSILGILLYEVFSCLEKVVCPWHVIETDTVDEESQSGSAIPVLSRIVTYAQMIKFSHTVFALPFALASLVLVRRVATLDISTIFWIAMAMVGARSAAMGFNRYVDAVFDANNPRTAARELPSNVLSRHEVIIFIVISSLVFILSAAMLSQPCFWLSFPILAVLFFYSYTKRFTWLSHIILGFGISLVPMAVWFAVTGTLSPGISVLSLFLLTYIAGFDVLYACQDIDFDRREGLHSIPAAFGVRSALRVSAFLHLVSVLSLAALYRIFVLHPLFLVFAVVIAVLFFVEHRLVKTDDLTQVNVAFYNINSIISVLLFVGILMGELMWGVL